jgi:hypothetical protein
MTFKLKLLGVGLVVLLIVVSTSIIMASEVMVEQTNSKYIRAVHDTQIGGQLFKPTLNKMAGVSLYYRGIDGGFAEDAELIIEVREIEMRKTMAGEFRVYKLDALDVRPIASASLNVIRDMIDAYPDIVVANPEGVWIDVPLEVDLDLNKTYVLIFRLGGEPAGWRAVGLSVVAVGEGAEYDDGYYIETADGGENWSVMDNLDLTFKIYSSL